MILSTDLPHRNLGKKIGGMSNASYMLISYHGSSLHGSRRAVVSHEAKKKQHACAILGLRDHYSELFTRMVALNF